MTTEAFESTTTSPDQEINAVMVIRDSTLRYTAGMKITLSSVQNLCP